MENNSEFPTRIEVSNGSDPNQPRTVVQSARDAAPFVGRRPNVETGSKKGGTRLALSVFDKLIGLSVFMIAVGVPLYFTSLSYQGIVFEKQMYFYFWLLIGLVSWAAKGVINEEMAIRKTPLDVPIIGFWAACLLSTVFSVDKWHSFWGAFGDPTRGFMSVTAMVILYYLIISNFDRKRLPFILYGLVGGGAALVFWSTLIFVKVPFAGGLVSSIVSGRLAQYVPLSLTGSITGAAAVFSAMLVLFTIAILKISEKEHFGLASKSAIGVLLLAILSDLVLLLSIYGFIPWAGLFAGIVVFLIYILSKIVRPKASWAWLPLVLFVAVMIVRMTGEVQISRVNFPTEASLNYKLSWDVALESLKSRFILGSGPATYGYDFSLHKPKYFNNNAFFSLRFSQGTGAVMESLSTLGALGTFFLAVLILSFLSVSFYLISREKEKNKLYSLGVLSAAFMLLVDVTVMKFEGTVLMMTVLVGIMALAFILDESDTQAKSLNLSLKASPKFALALAFVFMVISAGVAFLFVFLGKIYTADIYAGKAMIASASNIDNAASRMNDAVRLNPREGEYYAKLGEIYMALANREVMKGENDRNTDLIKNLVNNALLVSSAGSNLRPKDVEAWESLAGIYENSGVYLGDSVKMAEDAYKKALDLDPNNPSLMLSIGRVRIAEASLEKDQPSKEAALNDAKDYFQKAVDSKADFAPAYYQIALIDDALGDKDGAIDNATKAAGYDRSNADYLIGLANFYRFRGGDKDYDSSEAILKEAIRQNDKNVNAHFYLGLTYEKQKDRDNAKAEYQKVKSLLGDGSDDVKKQIDKMLDNLSKGVENTPESLGLSSGQQQDQQQQQQGQDQQPSDQPAAGQ